MSEHHPDFGEELQSGLEEELEEPPMFKVLLHNDDYTTIGGYTYHVVGP